MFKFLILYLLLACSPAFGSVEICKNLWSKFATENIADLPPDPEYRTDRIPKTALGPDEYRTIMGLPADKTVPELQALLLDHNAMSDVRLQNRTIIYRTLAYAAAITHENPQMPQRWRTIAAQRYLVIRETFNYHSALDFTWIATDSVMADGSFVFEGPAVKKIIVVRFPDGGIFTGMMSDLVGANERPWHMVTPDFSKLSAFNP